MDEKLPQGTPPLDETRQPDYAGSTVPQPPTEDQSEGTVSQQDPSEQPGDADVNLVEQDLADTTLESDTEVPQETDSWPSQGDSAEVSEPTQESNIDSAELESNPEREYDKLRSRIEEIYSAADFDKLTKAYADVQQSIDAQLPVFKNKDGIWTLKSRWSRNSDALNAALNEYAARREEALQHGALRRDDLSRLKYGRGLTIARDGFLTNQYTNWGDGSYQYDEQLSGALGALVDGAHSSVFNEFDEYSHKRAVQQDVLAGIRETVRDKIGLDDETVDNLLQRITGTHYQVHSGLTVEVGHGQNGKLAARIGVYAKHTTMSDDELSTFIGTDIPLEKAMAFLDQDVSSMESLVIRDGEELQSDAVDKAVEAIPSEREFRMEQFIEQFKQFAPEFSDYGDDKLREIAELNRAEELSGYGALPEKPQHIIYYMMSKNGDVSLPLTTSGEMFGVSSDEYGHWDNVFLVANGSEKSIRKVRKSYSPGPGGGWLESPDTSEILQLSADELRTMRKQMFAAKIAHLSTSDKRLLYALY